MKCGQEGCCFKADRPEEACGIFGVFAPGGDVARLTYFGLNALQHRGQESAGIAVADGQSILVFKEMGLANQVFNEQNLTTLQGHIAIGHVRYSTTGSTHWRNAQPVHKTFAGGTLALAHNGNLINTQQLRSELRQNGSHFRSTGDSEVIANLIAQEADSKIDEAVGKTMARLQGAYSVVILTEDKLYAIRDPYGIRPLSIGKLDGHYVISSETCGLDIVGAKYERDVKPGEIIKVDESGLSSKMAIPPTKPSLCIFEFIYFARPDSVMYDRILYHARRAMGMSLAEEAPVEADLVIGIPDTGTSAAMGYAEKSDISLGEGLIKNRYVGRTFIRPNQTVRQLGVKLKLNPLRQAIENRRLVVVDDSIVRGTTTQKIVRLLKEAGAKEVHMRITSPPVKWPCFYGIDTAIRAELIASRMSVEEVRKFIGADSLYYLSFEGLVKATKKPRKDFCLACFDGVYPIPIPPDVKVSKFVLEESRI